VEGPKPAGDLCGRKIDLLLNGKRVSSSEEGFFKTGEKPVFRLETREGFSLKLTEDHPVLRVQGKTPDGEGTEWVPAGKLRYGDRIKLNDHRSWTDWEGLGTLEQGYAIGLLACEGTAGEDEAVLSPWAPYAKAAGEENMGQGPMAVQSWPLGMSPVNEGVTRIMETAASSDFVRGFLGGLFDAGGSIRVEQEKGVSVRMAQGSLPALQAVQRMLLRLGIVGEISKKTGAGSPFAGRPEGHESPPGDHLARTGDFRRKRRAFF